MSTDLDATRVSVPENDRDLGSETVPESGPWDKPKNSNARLPSYGEDALKAILKLRDEGSLGVSQAAFTEDLGFEISLIHYNRLAGYCRRLNKGEFIERHLLYVVAVGLGLLTREQTVKDLEDFLEIFEFSVARDNLVFKHEKRDGVQGYRLDGPSCNEAK